MAKGPLVSVIVPTKNSAAFLEACLSSIKQQTYQPVELIVVDNHSTDATQKIAKQFTKQVYVQGPERSAQRNYGVAKSTGDYVAIIDSDMELTSKVIEGCLSALGDGQQTRAVIIPEESFGIGFWAQCKKLERSFYNDVDWMGAARFFDKFLYTELGGYNSELVSGEDWDLSQRAKAKTKLGRTDQMIRHNEGHLKLIASIKKKYYYAQHIKKYLATNKADTSTKSQAGPIARYLIFFKHPIKLFKNPILGLGMLFMKTSEFAFGAIGLISTSNPK